jgi:hypothetical protein
VWDVLGYKSTPAQMVHELIVSKIQGFQAGVVRRQAASTLDHRCNCLRHCIPIVRYPPLAGRAAYRASGLLRRLWGHR